MERQYISLIFCLSILLLTKGEPENFPSDFRSFDSFTSEEDFKLFEELGFWVPPAPPAIQEYIENCNPTKEQAEAIFRMQEEVERFQNAHNREPIDMNDQIFSEPFEKSKPSEPVQHFEALPINNPSSMECNCENELLPQNLVPDLILSSRLNSSKKRYKTFKHALTLMLRSNAKILIETGTVRYGNSISCEHEGCSTMFFAHYASLTHSKLFSVDNNQNSCNEARKATEQFQNSVEIVYGNSLDFLESFSRGMVDFLYLDSFDGSVTDSEKNQKHYLEEIKRIYPKLHKRSIILVDDCELLQLGKCRMIQEFLILQGWNLVMEDYQQLYVYSSI
jgi:predicted O-methyltransferase YrrM